MARNPLTAVPATRSSLPLLQIRRRIVLGFLSLSVLAGGFSTFAWMTSDEPTPQSVTVPNQTAVALAQTAVEDFLAARPSTVPAADGVDNDFSKATVSNGGKGFDVESLTFAESVTSSPIGDPGDVTPVVPVLERFTANIGGQLYSVTVPMLYTDAGWVIGAAPSIQPEKTAENQTATGIDYEDLYKSAGAIDGGSLPAEFRDRIKLWAETYAKAGPRDGALGQLVDKEEGSHRTYSGLGGWTLMADPSIQSAVPVSTPLEGYIVRVGLVLRSPATNGPTLSTDYDLYIKDDQSTTPPVVAWSAAGSYWTLQPYANAD